MAIAISREHVFKSRFKIHTFCFEKSENIYDYGLKKFVRKDFQYLNELNGFIRMASASGLIEKWHSDKRVRYRRNYNDDIKSVSNYNFAGSWMLYFILFAVLFLTVYCERLIHKKARQPNPMLFWLMAEMIIDPNRYFWLETKLINGNLVF